jgi:hypothetical protein
MSIPANRFNGAAQRIDIVPADNTAERTPRSPARRSPGLCECQRKLLISCDLHCRDRGFRQQYASENMEIVLCYVFGY